MLRSKYSLFPPYYTYFISILGAFNFMHGSQKMQDSYNEVQNHGFCWQLTGSYMFVHVHVWTTASLRIFLPMISKKPSLSIKEHII